jgi:hypothetical protein
VLVVAPFWWVVPKLSVIGLKLFNGRSLTSKLWLAQDPEADKLLAENPLALLVGMLLDHP